MAVVLIVEDHVDTALLYAEYLEHVGFCVVLADNGADGISQAQRHRPDLILMDLAMPRLDGLSALRRLRANPQTSQIPVIVLTGATRTAIADDARALGCDLFLTKPCSPLELAGQIRRVLADDQARAPRSSHGVKDRPHVVGEMKVLGHCAFAWREPLGAYDGARVYEVHAHHCERCIGELMKLGVQIDDCRRFA